MYSYVDHSRIKIVLRPIFSVFLIFTLYFNIFTPAHAVELPENKSWSWTHHNKMREQARLKALLSKQINEAGSSKTITAIVETKPTASKVGSSMMKRVTSAKGNVYAALGSYAVIELIEAIGWVMEDGTFVKKIAEQSGEDEDPNYYWVVNGIEATKGNYPAQACENAYVYYSRPNDNNVYKTANKDQNGSWYCPSPQFGYSSRGATISKKPEPIPRDPLDEKTVNLTPALLGAAMLGTGYNDPDPNFDNSTVNNDQWTGVEDAYTPDDSGIGNELADELESKADNAPQTSDGSASSFGDSAYQDDLSSNDNANDRSWQSGDGTEGSTDTTQTTDPETGTTSSTGSFNLPAFCDWAMSVCEWYDDWKASDQVYKDHMTKTEEHQTEEKSFWEKVKEWFDWTQEDTEIPDNSDDVEIKEIDIGTLDTSTFQATAGCPAPIQVPVDIGSGGNVEISYEPICQFAEKWSFIAPLIGFLSGAMIIVGVGRKGEDGEL